MNKKCPNCNLINFLEAKKCRRCNSLFGESSFVQADLVQKAPGQRLLWRAAVCLLVIIFAIFAFYFSLLLTSESLQYGEKQKVKDVLKIIEEKGFTNEAAILNYLTVFRSNDNWLNASVEKENAYAATNFPFEIVTIYPDFFNYPVDDIERAAILLHEAQHLKGAGEKEAYEFVWRNKHRLGWTKQNYQHSRIWQAVRKQTKEYAPNLFICQQADFGDCLDF